MKICNAHWSEIRNAIAAKGLAQFVATSAADAARKLATAIEGRGAENDFEPLVLVTGMLWEAGLECGGLAMLEGDFCPVCEAEYNGVEKGSWISGPVEAVFRAAKERGLV